MHILQHKGILLNDTSLLSNSVSKIVSTQKKPLFTNNKISHSKERSHFQTPHYNVVSNMLYET